MTTNVRQEQRSEPMRISLTGWTIFGATMLALLGAINLLQGITLLQYDDFLINQYIFDDLTFWGVAFVAFGAVQGVAAVLTFAHRAAGPRLGIAIASVSLVCWFFMILASPVSALVGMGLAVAIIASLATAW